MRSRFEADPSSALAVPQAVDPALFRDGNPWRVVTDLNEACNIQCSYCHIDALFGKDARDSRTLPPALVSKLLRDADEMGVFDVTFTGGEVTTMPNFDQYLEGVRDLDFTSVQIITNGTLLSTSRAAELKEAGIQRVSISIDGPESSNDEARGKGVWRRAWRGVESSVAAGLDVNVISVLGKHNIDNWYDLPPLLKQAGVRSQNISLMCRLGRAEAADEWQGVPEDRLDEVRRCAAKLQAELNDDTFFLSINDGVMQAPGWSGEPTPIHAFQDRNPGIEAVVKVTGEVLRNRLYGAGRAIGNLAEAALSDIWRADGQRRAEMSGVVGAENVGALPSLYYHYDDDATDVARLTTPTTAGSSDLRVREEPWGTVTFDPATFSIVRIAPKEVRSEEASL